MNSFPAAIRDLDIHQDKMELVRQIRDAAHAAGYEERAVDSERPWGAFINFQDECARQFIADFFPHITVDEARLGVDGAPLSPKILLVMPGQRLSLQRHARRAERWLFITAGDYYQGEGDSSGPLRHATTGEEVQIQAGQTHRICGLADTVVLVAEIWQHTDPHHLSNEQDEERLEDDYAR